MRRLAAAAASSLAIASAMVLPAPASRVGVLWDVDGTLVESTMLAFDATNEVLVAEGKDAVSIDNYKVGCRYTTPERFNFHMGLPVGSPDGARLGDVFDRTYVARVSPATAGLFPGMRAVLDGLAAGGHPLGALSNACGAYVRAVVSANEMGNLMGVALGADEVPAAKPEAQGLEACCEALGGLAPALCVYVGDAPSDGMAARAAGMRSVGVLWGANSEEKLRDHFDVLVADVPQLEAALATMCAALQAEAAAAV